MINWHKSQCTSPDILIKDGHPYCDKCSSTPNIESLLTRKNDQNLCHGPPPDPPCGQMSLHWPPSVPYIIEDHEVTKTDRKRTDSTVTVHSNSRIYPKTLDEERFRLLWLQPCDKIDDPIHVVLEVFNRDDHPEYECLSYTWRENDDDDEADQLIYVGCCWDAMLHTKNCVDTLRDFRLKTHARCLWLDAISINQVNDAEKSAQVALMGEIFARSCRVLVHLPGSAFTPSSRKYRQRCHIQGLEKFLVKDTLRDLTHRSRYFRRVWIIQELLLAKAVLIRFHSFDIDAGTQLLDRSEHYEDWSHSYLPWMQYVYGLKPFQLYRSLMDAIRQTWFSRASDERDKFYGILGLIHSSESQLRPDYALSFKEVFIGVIAHLVFAEGCWYLLQNAAGSAARPGFPSWLLDRHQSNPWTAPDVTTQVKRARQILSINSQRMFWREKYKDHISLVVPAINNAEQQLDTPSRSMPRRGYDGASSYGTAWEWARSNSDVTLDISDFDKTLPGCRKSVFDFYSRSRLDSKEKVGLKDVGVLSTSGELVLTATRVFRGPVVLGQFAADLSGEDLMIVGVQSVELNHLGEHNSHHDRQPLRHAYAIWMAIEPLEPSPQPFYVYILQTPQYGYSLLLLLARTDSHKVHKLVQCRVLYDAVIASTGHPQYLKDRYPSERYSKIWQRRNAIDFHQTLGTILENKENIRYDRLDDKLLSLMFPAPNVRVEDIASFLLSMEMMYQSSGKQDVERATALYMRLVHDLCEQSDPMLHQGRLCMLVTPEQQRWAEALGLDGTRHPHSPYLPAHDPPVCSTTLHGHARVELILEQTFSRLWERERNSLSDTVRLLVKLSRRPGSTESAEELWQRGPRVNDEYVYIRDARPQEARDMLGIDWTPERIRIV